METESERRCRIKKMEALSRMAASFSHDFNNMLGAIEGYATLLLNALPTDDPSRPDIEEIHKAERKAADIVKQLMLFSRGGLGRKIPVDMEELLDGVAARCRPASRTGVTFEVSCSKDLKPALADRVQLEQALANMAQNSIDAMPSGGKIRLKASNADLGGAAPQCPKPAECTSGFVRVSVEDEGVGMVPGTVERLFEPFFTTKTKGKGTGLGLAVVYGIIHRHNGWIEVASTPGKGTVFNVYLPQAAVAAGDAGPAPEKQLRSGADGGING